jgi:hypothetical protein
LAYALSAITVFVDNSSIVKVILLQYSFVIIPEYD